jgi:hypothetical protein
MSKSVAESAARALTSGFQDHRRHGAGLWEKHGVRTASTCPVAALRCAMKA